MNHDLSENGQFGKSHQKTKLYLSSEENQEICDLWPPDSKKIDVHKLVWVGDYDEHK